MLSIACCKNFFDFKSITLLLYLALVFLVVDIRVDRVVQGCPITINPLLVHHLSAPPYSRVEVECDGGVRPQCKAIV